MSFLYPHILWFLFLPALLAVLVFAARRKTGKGWMQLVSRDHAAELVVRRPAWRSVLPATLCILALTCAIAGLARPINGYREAGGLSTGRNLLIALDISRSMETEDVKPSRLEEARAAAFELIDTLKADKIGLIVFSGEADLVVPLTYDHTALRDALEQVNRSWAGTGGTNFGLVLKRAMQDFKRSAPDGTNALVLLSDGEDTVGSSIDVAEEARKNKLLVITVGVGTAVGGPIPDPKGENGLWQDEDGKHVISKLDANALRKFSEATGGDFAVLDSNTDLTAFTQNAVRKIDKHEENVSTNKVPNDLFPWFAWVALALLLAAILAATEWRLPKRGAAAVVLLLLLAPAAHAVPDASSVLTYTTGLALEGNDDAKAREAFSSVLLDEDPQIQAAAFYQIGNVGSNATIGKLRKLYGEGEDATGAQQTSTDPEEDDDAAPAAQQGPKQPSIEELEKIVEELKQDILPYESALKIDPSLSAATRNIEKIKQLIKDLEEEIERLKQQQQQQQQQDQQNQQDQQDQKDQKQQNKDQQKNQDSKDKQDQKDQQDQKQQDKDKQQQDQQDQKQNQDSKDKQDQKDQQDQKQQDKDKQQQGQQDQQQNQDSKDKQDQDKQNKPDQKDRQQEQQRKPVSMSEEEKAQQSAADVLRMHLDEEKGSPIPHAPADTVRKPRKDY